MDVEIEQATPEQIEVVASILQEAAAWAERAHGPLWVEAEVSKDNIRQEVEEGQFFIARSGAEPYVEAAGVIRSRRCSPRPWGAPAPRECG